MIGGISMSLLLLQFKSEVTSSQVQQVRGGCVAEDRGERREEEVAAETAGVEFV